MHPTQTARHTHRWALGLCLLLLSSAACEPTTTGRAAEVPPQHDAHTAEGPPQDAHPPAAADASPLKDASAPPEDAHLPLDLALADTEPPPLDAEAPPQDAHTAEDAQLDEPDSQPPAESASAQRYPIDLMLIYQGDSAHRTWNSSDYAAYLAWAPDGETEWLYDGFLFLTLSTEWQGGSYYFDGDPARGERMATKAVWQAWLDELFTAERGPHALEAALTQLTEQGAPPAEKRKVIFAIPYPVHEDLPWGELGGRDLQFSDNADRLRAVQWYVEQVHRRWHAQHYAHLELAGFYWLREEAFRTADVELIGQVSAHLRTVNPAGNQLTSADPLETAAPSAPDPPPARDRYDFYWIPYNSQNDNRAAQWRELGFDIAYFQPNYFFSPETPISQLEAALLFAEAHEMGAQLEFTGQIYDAQHSDTFLPRFLAYLEHFTRHDLWQRTRLAYYDSAGAWRYMATQPLSPAVQAAYQQLGRHLADRKRRTADFEEAQ